MKRVLAVTVLLLILGGCSEAFMQGFGEGMMMMGPPPQYYPHTPRAEYDKFGTGTIYNQDGSTSTLYYNEY